MSDHDKLREAIERCRTQLGRDRVSVRPDVQFGYAGCLARGADIEAICDAAESTLPKTKMVETWRVAYTFVGRGDIEGTPSCTAFRSEHAARAWMSSDNRDKPSTCYRFMTLTGPHQQEVPA